jgi:hypothetical protein
MSPLFSISNYPTLLPQVVEATPASFEGLQQLRGFLELPSLVGRVSLPPSRKIRPYLAGFFNHLRSLSKEERSILKEKVGTRDPELLPLFTRLAPGTIDPFGERTLFSKVMQVVYEEAEKAFNLLDHIEKTGFPRSLREQFDLIFAALMKQSELTEETLPLPFKGAAKKVLEAFRCYATWSEEERDRARNEILYDTSFHMVPLHLLLYV